MEPIYRSCCGLDVHRRSIQACVRRLGKDGIIHQEPRTLGTMTRDILEMADWLAAEVVTHVAMEATGVYWKPIYPGWLPGPPGRLWPLFTAEALRVCRFLAGSITYRQIF